MIITMTSFDHVQEDLEKLSFKVKVIEFLLRSRLTTKEQRVKSRYKVALGYP
jgi:hypothetical protein